MRNVPLGLQRVAVPWLYLPVVNVLAVTETLSAKSAAKGNTLKVGWS